MRTMYEAPSEYVELMKKIVEEHNVTNGIYPKRFHKVMQENKGFVNHLMPYLEGTEDGLERRNPLVVVLGDSVTAGHFEMGKQPERILELIKSGKIEPDTVLEIIDVRESYVEKFRSRLIDKYELTSVNVLNAGIGGDTLLGMKRRLERDVIVYQPDLVILNGALNWMEKDGGREVYEQTLIWIVERVKKDTSADLFLLTPNMEVDNLLLNQDLPLQERVSIIRNVAEKTYTGLVDVYRIWEIFEAEGGSVKAMLANGVNHPSKECHDIYAMALMQLFTGYN